MTTRTGNFVTQSSSSAKSKNSPMVPLLKKNDDHGKCLNYNFYRCFPWRTSFLIFITALTQKKKIDKVFPFIF